MAMSSYTTNRKSLRTFCQKKGEGEEGGRGGRGRRENSHTCWLTLKSCEPRPSAASVSSSPLLSSPGAHSLASSSLFDTANWSIWLFNVYVGERGEEGNRGMRAMTCIHVCTCMDVYVCTCVCRVRMFE